MPDTVIVKAYKKNNTPSAFILNYATLVGEPLFIDITAPYINASKDPLLKGYEVESFTIQAGDKTLSGNGQTIKVVFDAPGVYDVKLVTVFKNGETAVQNIKDSIRVYNKWPEYDYTNTRILSNIDPALPYTLEEVSIKPNEFGVADIDNAAITKLHKCLEQIKNYCTVIYNKTPTVYIGWLGVHSKFISKKIQWYLSSATPDLSKDSDNALSDASNYSFNNISDVKTNFTEVYIASKTQTGEPCILFGDTIQPRSTFKTISNLLFLTQIKNITCMEVEVSGLFMRTIYILDNLSNKIYKALIDLNSTNLDIVAESDFIPAGDLLEVIGGFGGRDAASRFYSPGDMKLADGYLYIVDTNNLCIKKFSSNLGWIRTYYVSDFDIHHPISVAVNSPKETSNGKLTSLLYVLTDTGRVYMLNQDGTIFNNNVPYIEVLSDSTPKKIVFDTAQDFFYIIYETAVLKYSVLGLFINAVQLPSTNTFVSGCADRAHNMYIACRNKIYKFLDLVESFSIYNKEHEALMWSKQDLQITDNEFAQDWSINRSLSRIATNVDIFRKSIHSRFGITTVYSNTDSFTYYTAIPIAGTATTPCSLMLENIGIGANEFTLSHIVNRDIEKIYNCIDSLREFTTATYLTKAEGGTGCTESFCWSWKNTKCFNITLPILQICNINPITFAELRSNVTGSYAPSITWKEAIGDCCTR